MHVSAWVIYALVALIFWGITGVTQKLSTNNISTQLSFLWFIYAMLAIGLVIFATVPIQLHMQPGIFWLAIVGGALNGLGVLTSFAAFEKGGKASIVVPLCYLFPLVTVLLAITFLHESLTRTEVVGIAVAVLAAILLSQEGKTQEEYRE
jgi:bacterial/archaeal transporter family protein